LIQQFGSSKEFVKSVTHAFEGSDNSIDDISPSNLLDSAIQVSDCGYEYGTCWGKQVSYINKFIFQTNICKFYILLMRKGDMHCQCKLVNFELACVVIS